MASGWTRRLVWTAAALGVAGAFAWALWPSPVLVDLATIGRATLEVTVEDEGVTRIRDVYTVSAPTAGKMLRSPLTVGDPVVAEKTVVARFEPGDPVFLDARTRRVAEAAVEGSVGEPLGPGERDVDRGQGRRGGEGEHDCGDDRCAHVGRSAWTPWIAERQGWPAECSNPMPSRGMRRRGRLVSRAAGCRGSARRSAAAGRR